MRHGRRGRDDEKESGSPRDLSGPREQSLSSWGEAEAATETMRKADCQIKLSDRFVLTRERDEGETLPVSNRKNRSPVSRDKCDYVIRTVINIIVIII